MPKSLSLCIEMEPAPDLCDEAVRRAVEVNPRNAADSQGARTRYWWPGTQLRVRLLDGDPTLQRRVASVVLEWSEHANITFSFGDASAAEIRVTFTAPSLWSYVGTDALLVPNDKPTMCLGALMPQMDDQTIRKVVLHEFGHVLGLTHEYQNPVTSLPWDKQEVYAYLLGPPYRWSKEQVEANLFAKYSADSTQFSVFDGESIMLAPIPNTLTVGDFEIGWNQDLSTTDKAIAASIYPHSPVAEPSLPPLPRGETTIVWTVGLETGGLEALSLEVEAVTNYVVEAATGARELEEEEIRLDVAHPALVRVDEVFDIAVAVRQPDAPVLTIEDLPTVVSDEGTVYRPAGEAVIKYRIEVIGADCSVSPSHYVILLGRGENAPPRYFQVTAHKPGWRTIVVNAYQEDEALAAQTRVRIEVQLPVLAPTRFNDLQLPSQIQENPTVDIVLTPGEIKQFKEALISAFRRGNLEQVVFYGLEVRFDDIVPNGNFDTEVNDLVMWANDHNKVEPLLKEARNKNSGNLKLREFDAYIEATRQRRPDSNGQTTDPLKGLKGQLIDELSKLPVTESYNGRTSLLDGIPGADTLNRNENSKRQDLDQIVTQLAKLGRLANGQMPVVKLIDNALPFARGYEGEGKLRAIQQQLT